MKTMKWILTLLIILCTWNGQLLAADYPNRPVNLLMGYAAGGIGDLNARALASAAEPLFGQPLVVLNKPGATGAIMMSQLAGSKPDGYTIAVTPASMSISPYFQKVAYDLTKDFTYILALNTFLEAITVRQDSPWKTLNDVIEYARKNPNKLRIAGSSIASSSSLMTKVIAKKADIQYTEVPFGATGEAITAMLGGHIDVVHASGDHLPQVRAGKLRMLAIATPERSKEFPNVPTLRELGYDFVAMSYCGIAGPKGMPEPIVKKLEDVFKKARQDKGFTEFEKKVGLSPVYEVGKDYERRVIDIYNFVGTFLKKSSL